MLVKYKELLGECYDFSCGEGWNDILDRLFAAIVALPGAENTHVETVKEKWGLLRIYIDTGSDVVYDLIDQAERESAETCEYCGAKDGVTTSGSWLKTLCPNCRKA